MEYEEGFSEKYKLRVRAIYIYTLKFLPKFSRKYQELYYIIFE